MLGFLTSFINLTAQASMIKVGVEPYLGYSQFNYGDGTYTDSQFGTILGGRGGFYLSQDYWVALDYHLGGPYALDDDEHEYLNRMWGVGVGTILKSRARFWGGYYYDCTIDDIERAYQFKGTGYKASAGVVFQSKLNLNIEYVSETFDKVVKGKQKITEDLQVYIWFISISSPLLIF